MILSTQNRRPKADANPLTSSDARVASYGWALLCGHFAVLLFFLDANRLAILTKSDEAICWPYFQNCWKFRFETQASVNILLLIYAAFIVISCLALNAARNRLFWVSLAVVNAFLFVILSLDYRLRGNQEYMLLWVNAVFLLWPAKRWAIPLIIMSFYFWAGMLKLNYEWLSGAVLYHDLYFIPPKFAWVACTYVVVLEMVLIWGLLAKRKWVRWLTLGQLMLFHIESVSQVGWFYPVLMAALLSWFVLEWLCYTKEQLPTLAKLWRGNAPRSVYALIMLFASFQLVPYLYHGDQPLTAQGRIFSLDMLQSRPVCDVHAVVHNMDQTTDVINLLMPNLGARQVCDPLIYFDRMTNLCRSHVNDPSFVDADFAMHSRRTTDQKMTIIADEKDFCRHHETYNMFSNNRWIK